MLIGCLEVRVGQYGAADAFRGALLLACVDVARATNRIPRAPLEEADYQRLRQTLRDRLAPSDARAAAEAGRALSLAEAIAQAGF